MKRIAGVILLALVLLILGTLVAREVWLDAELQTGNCPNNLILNGNFEQGDASWLSLPDSRYPGPQIVEFGDSYDGQYSAMLGGDEGTSDSIRQLVTIPSEGYLTYWWRMNTYETTVFNDSFGVYLLNEQGEYISTLTWHGISGVKDTWFQDSLDLRPYAGTKVWLKFSVINDHNFFSTFYIDSVCLAGSS